MNILSCFSNLHIGIKQLGLCLCIAVDNRNNHSVIYLFIYHIFDNRTHTSDPLVKVNST